MNFKPFISNIIFTAFDSFKSKDLNMITSRLIKSAFDSTFSTNLRAVSITYLKNLSSNLNL